MNPICSFLNALNFFDESVWISTLFNLTVPWAGWSRVPIIWRKVLLPAPEAPIIVMISPLSTSRSTPLRICKLPYDFLIPLA